MTIEADIFTALRVLVADRVYPDLAPATAGRPYIVWQQVGGQAFSFLEAAPVGKRNARIQVACWAETRQAANDLARLAEDTLAASSMSATPLGAFAADYDEDAHLYGTRQDFSVFY